MEIWKEIDGCKDYYISNTGRVKSIKLNKEWIKSFRTRKNGYLCIRLIINNKKKWISIHQLVGMSFLGYKPNTNNLVIDHINGIKNDNRLENLRVVTHRENINLYYDNTQKSSKFRGVSFHKLTHKWISQISINGKNKYLGLFNSEQEAHMAYRNSIFLMETGHQI
jgi:hypothetical protein